jgi:hypothetical protein
MGRKNVGQLPTALLQLLFNLGRIRRIDGGCGAGLVIMDE